MALDIKYLESEIQDQYLNDHSDRPWIIGFSGGKDSTMLLQLVWIAIKKIPAELRTRHIYVVCNDTLVENPKIAQFVHRTLDRLQVAAAAQSMPITVHETTPSLEETFWVNLLGKGYPAPNNMFRWCTERLKINPTTEFIKSKISETGEVIILLGTRSAESTNRARSIKRYEVKGERLRKHILPSAYVFALIKDVLTDEVWTYLLQVDPPWGGTNRDLVTLYRNANGGDCPLVIDDTTPSCGNSRFGCWVCTVVNKDKSMEALIDNGEEWMEPLSEFRDMLQEERNNRDWREKRRRNSDITGEDVWGPYYPEKRAYMLKVLLEAQREIQRTEPDLVLINYQELVAIQVTWHRDSIFKYSVAEIYNEVYGTELNKTDFSDNTIFEKEILQEACHDDTEFGLINELLEIQKSRYIMVNNYGLQSDIENHLEYHIKNRKQDVH
ncbi:DNA phosphorothioation system sulfurtransferase DndC [Mucilaginibacter gossypii]|uniref:DNA phosphorothioation system sulfurtransferase DndC n=1 Tax=Mucilaginibacter gossypii TaxID=551996 RepID=UPI000DCD8707|nr:MULTISPECIES: DNA phosphorothioation system sulfurtransferase DndC [Mucilaginibacter]QTE36367.1 DNA phosphorothioation system sulfurtransferase DndC [Mucilaginibacter gossypii]RAV55863.1 DNA phosphorothioation system sulfurtransferase DndC [Mucilaginibacter rubeus]